MVHTPQFNTPGEVLAAARQKSGISLADLSTRTKIPVDMLQAIERDEYHKISGDLYVKSFMASFATEVDVEPELVVGMYRDFSGERPESTTGELSNQWDEDTVEVSSLGLPWLKIALSLVALACVAGGLYYFVLHDNGDSGTVSLENVPDEMASLQATIVDSASVKLPATSVGPDTLSLGWQSSVPAIEKEIFAVKPAVAETPLPVSTVEDSSSRILSTLGRGHLPNAFPGDHNVEFAGKKKSWPVVLRLVCDERVDLQLKRDAESKFAAVIWPDSGVQGTPLPASGLLAGQAYEVRQGFAVYWGAEDHFSLIIPESKKIEISINGVVRDLSRIKSGQEIIMDAPATSSDSY